MKNWRSSKYVKYPRTAEEIEKAFQTPSILEDLGTSLHHTKKVLFNTIQRGDGFENLIFSSAESLRLIKEETKDEVQYF